MYPVIQHEMPWSPTCTTKQCKASLIRTNRVDSTSSVPCSNRKSANQLFIVHKREQKKVWFTKASQFDLDLDTTQVAQHCGMQQKPCKQLAADRYLIRYSGFIVLCVCWGWSVKGTQLGPGVTWVWLVNGIHHCRNGMKAGEKLRLSSYKLLRQ